MLVPTLLIALCATALATPISRDLSLHEELAAIPEGFTASGPASGDALLSLRFTLVPGNIAGLEKTLYDISTPGSANYGNHLTQDELATYVRPTSEATALFSNWLSSNNLTATSASFAGDILEVSLPVSKANTLLGADFQMYTAQSSGKKATRSLAYSIPSSLKGHLDNVHPTVNFPASPIPIPPTAPVPPLPPSNATSPNSSLPDSCHSVITPTCLQDLYSIPKTPATQQSNKLFVSGFSGQWANKADLTTFLKKNRPDLSANTSFALISVANGTNPQKGYDAGIEANLDIQYTTGIASGVPISFVSVGPTDTETDKEFFVALQDEANALLTMKTPPTVLTSSYSLNENLISQSLAKSICNLYMQLGARGVSVLFSSGDGGIGGGHPTECKNKPFLPTFPGVCPYVTAVGATQIDHSSDHEKGANFGGGSSSSGGFSNYFPTPAYQSAQVSSYVKALGSTYAGRYNASGRGLPDVSAVGVNYTIVADQHAELVNGTSCSTPMFAGLVALLNDRLIAAGKAPLGFLNPLLYSAGGTAALTDITVGNNPGCGTKGFNATKGWDPVTGLGTPVFPKLLTAIGL